MTEGENRKASGAAGTSATAGTCPICSKPASKAFVPFCSARCADVDLNRWLGGIYAVPTRPDDDEDEEPAPHS